MKLLVNQYERVTHSKLVAVCREEGAHVCPKVRVKDALPVEGSGISREQFTFSLKSHFDFVVTDKDYNILFAVEFDGPCHQEGESQRRDNLKDDLCSHFELPLLRINANHLDKKFLRWDLLTYFIETWFLKRAFEEAQEEGSIPWDEDVDPMSIYSDGKGKRWPYWFSAPSQLAIQRLHKEGRICHRVASHIAGYDPRGNRRYLAYVKINDDSWVFTTTAMRSQLFDVCTTDVLEQIGTVDLYQRLLLVLAGKAPTVGRVEINRKFEDFIASCQPCSWGGIVEEPLTMVRGGMF
jgi:hypothetical protein